MRTKVRLGGHLAVLLIIPLLAIGILIAGASGSDAASPGAGKRVSVTIENFTFTPHFLHVKVGTTVTWINLDANVGHTVTSGTNADAHVWKSSGLLFQGMHFSVTFKKTGTFKYFCMPHFYNPAMHGVIVVTK